MTAAWVFVYGTLLPGGSNHDVVAPYVLEIKVGQVMGRLVDVGSYPACVRDEEASRNGSRVRGLWLLVVIAGMAAMDELEEFYGIEEVNDYERVFVKDAHDDDIAGWTYCWPTARGCPPIGESSWPDYCRRLGRTVF
ncbi:gamma-glutamylcyclotransferase [Paenibacillus sp. J5C_2022]|uniref:gamma-glutamylcyclotransferase family protein n=1 Tax=Paenibacillus sp. J5C2022 TaxID=2977129 RepID=UPI0021CE0B80|nr:gamma-glutamylcyclotransferase family protein [Paenibacillus sp. J5C2022]MCU6710344.1 gamma-glutamylcyclotransferase [Paenibacillus sp. J5C2022]